jgi:hypothetical protein
MKLSIFLSVIIFFIIGYKSHVSSTKFSSSEERLETNVSKLIHADSVDFITPNVELFRNQNNSTISDETQSKRLREKIITALQNKLPQANYIEAPLMFKSRKKINTVIERLLFESIQNPKQKIKAPKEFITSQKKYTLFISINAVFGDINKGKIKLTIVNNKENYLEFTKEYLITKSIMAYAEERTFLEKELKEVVKLF